MKVNLKPSYQLLLLAAVTLGIYYPTLFAPFNSLDDLILVNHLLNQEGFSLSRHFAPGGANDYYRPLLSLTLEIDHHLGGLQEPFMHLVNILVHMVNVGLVWLLARRIGRLLEQPSAFLPFFAALLFALHPINTEAVNWILGRSDLLAGTFVLVALICLFKFLEEQSMVWGAAGALSVLCGTLCKETALFLIPGACFLLLCRPFAGSASWRWRWSLPGFYGLAVAGYFALRWNAFQSDRGLGHTTKLLAHAAGISPSGAVAAAPADPFPWLDAIRVVLKASGFYLVKLFQPLPLNFAIDKLAAYYLVPGVILVVVLAILIWRRRFLGALLLISASLAVSALFVLFTRLAWTPIAERYMYIPGAPFVIALVFGAGSFLTKDRWRRPVLLMMVLLTSGAAMATVGRNLVWQDNLTLYQDTVRKSPEFAPAKNQLAMALLEHGRKEEALVILAENAMKTEDAADALNQAAALWEEGNYPAARAKLLDRLQNPGAQEIRILEKLVQITTEQAMKTGDTQLQRTYYLDILVWLERIRTLWPNGFTSYRIGQIQLFLQNQVSAQQAFAEAARQLPPDSLYKEPATKLARNLLQ